MKRIEDIDMFRNRFQDARGKMTLINVAERSGISERMVRHYSAGTKTPGTGHLKKLAAVLDVSPEWLAGESIFKTRMEERFARFKLPEDVAASKSIGLIYQAIEELAEVHGYDLGFQPEIEVDGGLGYDGRGVAMWLAAMFEHELEKQCSLHLKKKENPHQD